MIDYDFGPRKPFFFPDQPEVKPKASDVQVGGAHYKHRAIHPERYAYENNLGWHEGEVVKYVTRWKDKNGKEDLQKAIHVLQLLLEHQK